MSTISEQKPVEPATIGGRIARARAERKLTQRALSNEVGVTQNVISAWERDEYVPRVKHLEKLCEVLGVTMPAILHGDAEKAASAA